jgi:hypothetical protein
LIVLAVLLLPAVVSELLLLLLLLLLPQEASASMDLRRFVDALSRLIVACGRSLQQDTRQHRVSHHAVAAKAWHMAAGGDTVLGILT